jgi:hypothetical protein
MLTYLLAFAVAIASIGLYAITFFLPAFKREQDLIWSGVGLFYALVLWACAGQVRGGLLLGQMASVGLIGWLGWQAFGARWAGLSQADKEQAKVLTEIKSKLSSINLDQLGSQAKGLADKAKGAAKSVADKTGDAKGLVDKAKEAAQSVADKTKDASGLMDKAKEAAQSVADKTKDVAVSGKKNTETYVRKSFQDAATAAPEPTSEVVKPITQKVEAAVDPVVTPEIVTPEVVTPEVVTPKVTTTDATASTTSVDVKKAFADASSEVKETIEEKAVEVAETVTETAEAIVDDTKEA